MVLVLSDAISLRWSLPEHTEHEDEFFYQGYRVLYRPINIGSERFFTVEGHGKRSYFLSGLRPKTIYQVRVKGFSAQGDGPVSLPVTVTTLESGKL